MREIKAFWGTTAKEGGHGKGKGRQVKVMWSGADQSISHIMKMS